MIASTKVSGLDEPPPATVVVVLGVPVRAEDQRFTARGLEPVIAFPDRTWSETVVTDGRSGCDTLSTGCLSVLITVVVSCELDVAVDPAIGSSD